MSSFPLTSARYGKINIKILRVVKNDRWHEVVEYTVEIALEGQIATSFTHADNSGVVATDSIKNTVHVLAKVSPHILTPELFALHLGLHFVSEYKQIEKCFVNIISHRWSRISIEEKPHPHAFTRDGNDTIKVEANVSRSLNTTSVELFTGIADLLVLKSSGSSFENFVRDKWTTLPEVSDRILSTYLDCKCAIKLNLPSDNSLLSISSIDHLGINFKKIHQSIRKKLLETFANDQSASAQATIYRMCNIILETHLEISNVDITFPNVHYVPIDLSWFENIQNTSVQDAEVFQILDAPSGLITATVSREDN